MHQFHDDTEGESGCGPTACGHGPRGLAYRHHGPRGPHGPGFGPRFGPFGRAKRGNVRAAVLAVLAERPMHGYEIMQELEERSGGAWRPSPGSVYPTLQLLEDQGLVKGEEAEGKRVFTLTPEGQAEAAKVTEAGARAPWDATPFGDDPRSKLRQAVMQIRGAARQVGMGGTPEQVEQALAILAEARKRLYQLLAEGA